MNINKLTVVAGVALCAILGFAALRPAAAAAVIDQPVPIRAPIEPRVTSDRTLKVTGQGMVQVNYDTATITVGISALAKDPKGAYEAMSANINRVADQMKAAGIKEADLQTGTLSLYEEYNYTEKGRESVGYRANTTLAITTKDLNQVADLVQLAVASGANQLQGVRFSLDDQGEAVATALDVAVDDARQKAERLAQRLGTKIVGVASVEVMQSAPIVPYPMPEMARAGSVAMDAAQIYAGTETITATVSITFELQ